MTNHLKNYETVVQQLTSFNWQSSNMWSLCDVLDDIICVCFLLILCGDIFRYIEQIHNSMYLISSRFCVQNM